MHKSDNSENRSNQAIPADSPRRCRGTREEGSWPSCRVYAERLGRGSAQGGTGEFRRGKLCADVEGFSLHAGVLIPDYCRDKLEQLCRYAARPPVVHARMSLTDGGKVLYKLKKKFRDGSTLVVLDPLDLIARLAALVPRPRVHLVNYFGVLAPAASYRDRIVPPPPDLIVNSTGPASTSFS